MSRRFGITLLFLFFCTAAWAQTQREDEIFNGPHLDKLIGEARYEEAFELIKAGIEKNQALETYSAVYYALLAKFYMETGRPKDAGDALKAADTIAARTGIGNGFTAREMAAYLIAQGDFGAAASWATKAVRETSYRKSDGIVVAYCRSLEATARLRTGDLKRAESLIREALDAVPRDNDAPPYFAPRILFAACVIESQRANYEEALELYRRGLEVLEKKKVDSRDVSLGHLAMAESYLLKGDPAKCREFASKSMEHTATMFQPQHHDTISALVLLARADLKEAKPADALAHAKAAVDMSVSLFGEGAGATKGPKQIYQEAVKANTK